MEPTQNTVQSSTKADEEKMKHTKRTKLKELNMNASSQGD